MIIVAFNGNLCVCHLYVKPKPVLSEPNIPAPKTTCAPPLQSQMSAPTPPPASEGEVSLHLIVTLLLKFAIN